MDHVDSYSTPRRRERHHGDTHLCDSGPPAWRCGCSDSPGTDSARRTVPCRTCRGNPGLLRTSRRPPWRRPGNSYRSGECSRLYTWGVRAVWASSGSGCMGDTAAAGTSAPPWRSCRARSSLCWAGCRAKHSLRTTSPSKYQVMLGFRTLRKFVKNKTMSSKTSLNWFWEKNVRALQWIDCRHNRSSSL